MHHAGVSKCSIRMQMSVRVSLTPYVMDTRADPGKDYRHEMTDADHKELVHFLRGLKGHVMVSGYRSEIYEKAFKDWRRVDKAALADGARNRVESLWLSPGISGGLFE